LLALFNSCADQLGLLPLIISHKIDGLGSSNGPRLMLLLLMLV